MYCLSNLDSKYSLRDLIQLAFSLRDTACVRMRDLALYAALRDIDIIEGELKVPSSFRDFTMHL